MVSRGVRSAFLACCVVLVAMTACFGPDPNVSDSGKGIPLPVIEFPGTVEPGAIEIATLEVTNPGPEEIQAVVVAFARLGFMAPGQTELPTPLIEPKVQGEPSAILGVEPEPVGTNENGLVFRFGPLAEGESMSIEFELQMPDDPGSFGNSIQVYAGEDVERARGVRLLTEVKG